MFTFAESLEQRRSNEHENNITLVMNFVKEKKEEDESSSFSCDIFQINTQEQEALSRLITLMQVMWILMTNFPI